MALWCGNNENHWAFHEWWNDSQRPLSYGGEICYNNIAPSIVRKNSPHIPYWNGSPYGGEDPNGNNAGDRHHWHDCTMNPDMRKRITPEEYDKISAKFISEFGYIGPCRKSSTIKYYCDKKIDINSEIWRLHSNTHEEGTVPAGIEKHYTDPSKLDFDGYLLYAGLCQGLMLGYALEAIRFKINCWGALFWMHNDCWREIGWSIIDYYLKRKIAYNFVKRAFMHKKMILREMNGTLKVVGINESSEVVSFEAEYGYTTLDGKMKDSHSIFVEMQPYSRQTILEFSKKDYDPTAGFYFVKPLNCPDILHAVLRLVDFRRLKVQTAKLKILNYEKGCNWAKFLVSSDTFAHGVHFDLDDSLRISDEFFDLLPGESREILVHNVPDEFEIEHIKARCINTTI